MVKTTTAGMDTHLASEVTTLAMATVIERIDGQDFRLTTSSEDISIDIGDGDGVQTYSASEGVIRTNIENDSELNVDNLDVLGIFTNNLLDETELRRGLFDFAEFKIFVFNHQDLSVGIIKIFRGQLGRTIVTPQGFFKTTVRSIVQVYSKETGESYSKECRADLGDIRCRVPLAVDIDSPTDRTNPLSEITSNQAYSLGDFLVVPVDPANNTCAAIKMNFEGADGAMSGPGFTNIGTVGDPDSINGTSQIDTAQIPAGGDSTSSLLLDGNSDTVRWNDNSAFTMGSNEVTIQAHFRINATGVNQTLISHYSATGNQRGWILRVDSTNVLRFLVYDDGISVDVDLLGTTGLTTGVDYHANVARKSNGDWVMMLDGAIEAGPTTPTGDPHNSTTSIRIGAIDSGGLTHYFNGWIDSLEFMVGFARWETAFTPPTGNLSAVDPVLTWEDFGDRVYEVTTAGTSAACINAPDTTITNTHSQGTAVLTANHSWMRFAEVTAVDGTETRRTFTVTELTPNSGQAVGSNSLPSTLGFPDDWFNGGGVFFITGNNAGISKEVRDFTADDGITIEQVIEAIEDWPFDIEVGDKLRVFAGCDKTAATCIGKFNNEINAVAERFVPGEDVLGQYPDAR